MSVWVLYYSIPKNTVVDMCASDVSLNQADYSTEQGNKAFQISLEYKEMGLGKCWTL